MPNRVFCTIINVVTLSNRPACAHLCRSFTVYNDITSVLWIQMQFFLHGERNSLVFPRIQHGTAVVPECCVSLIA
jgi:hypothetical protein